MKSTPVDPGTVRPDNVPEKFWNAEKGAVNTDALLASYGSLESRLSGAPAQEPTEPLQVDLAIDTEATVPVVGDTPEVSDDSLFSAAKMAEYGEALAKDGKLSDEHMAAFAEGNIPAEVVNTYMEAVKTKAHPIDAVVHAELGSKENFDQMSAWLAEKGTPEQIAAYNDAVNTGVPAAATLAAKELKRLYQAQHGTPTPARVGGSPATNSADPAEMYSTWAQIKESAKNPLYKSSAAYRQQHANRVAAGMKAGHIK